MLDFVRKMKSVNSKENLSKSQAARIMATVTLPAWLQIILQPLSLIIILMMWSGSTFTAYFYWHFITEQTGHMNSVQKALLFSITPVLFLLSFIFIGGTLSLLGQKGIIAGKFPRLTSHPIYMLRKLYGAAWTQIFYFKPLYAVCLSVPWFKKILFRMYGYRGNLNFTLYPDAWIRDLPLLKMGHDVYLANRCTVGTNLCLNDGSILVGECHFNDNSMVGHLAVFGLGSKIGARTEVGVSASLGIRVSLGDSVVVSPKVVIYHGVQISDRVRIGACSVIGMKSRISSDIELNFGAVIPARATLRTQADADKYFSAETKNLHEQTQSLTEALRKNLDDFGEGRS